MHLHENSDQCWFMCQEAFVKSTKVGLKMNTPPRSHRWSSAAPRWACPDHRMCFRGTLELENYFYLLQREFRREAYHVQSFPVPPPPPQQQQQQITQRLESPLLRKDRLQIAFLIPQWCQGGLHLGEGTISWASRINRVSLHIFLILIFAQTLSAQLSCSALPLQRVDIHLSRNIRNDVGDLDHCSFCEFQWFQIDFKDVIIALATLVERPRLSQLPNHISRIHLPSKTGLMALMALMGFSSAGPQPVKLLKFFLQSRIH